MDNQELINRIRKIVHNEVKNEFLEFENNLSDLKDNLKKLNIKENANTARLDSLNKKVNINARKLDTINNKIDK